jgi:hypothetical protein
VLWHGDAAVKLTTLASCCMHISSLRLRHSLHLFLSASRGRLLSFRSHCIELQLLCSSRQLKITDGFVPMLTVEAWLPSLPRALTFTLEVGRSVDFFKRVDDLLRSICVRRHRLRLLGLSMKLVIGFRGRCRLAMGERNSNEGFYSFG